MTTHAHIVCLAAAIVLALPSGCGDPTVPKGGPATDKVAQAATEPSSPAAATCTARPRRLSVAQVEKSIAALFGGIVWRPSPTSKTNYFKTYASTLGKADYITITEESYEPSMLFMKYMDDMAGYVCRQAVARDATEPDWASRLVVPFPDDVDLNLRFLRLKFHSVYVDESDPKAIAPYRKLYEDVLAATSDMKKAWEAVCVAMVTAPEFLIL